MCKNKSRKDAETERLRKENLKKNLQFLVQLPYFYKEIQTMLCGFA